VKLILSKNISYRLNKKILEFNKRQLREIRQGGFPVFSGKLKRLLAERPLTLIALPVVLFIRILRPLTLIRFGQLRSERIGHYVGNTEIYLCDRDLGIQNTCARDFFYNADNIVCNKQLKKMYARILNVYPFVKYLYKANRIIAGGEKHTVTLSTDRDFYGRVRKTEPHLFFTDEEEYLGKQYLESKGINDGDKFVCIYARDNAYLNKVHPRLSKNGWKYHDYRNSCIDDFLETAEEMTKRSYYIFRMGSVVKKEFKTNNSMIIDYASNGDRTDFLDIYLFANCHIALSAGGGPSSVPIAFRRPLGVVNYIPLEYCNIGFGINDISIPKKIWLKKEKRFMTFREIIKAGAGKFVQTYKYEELGIEPVNNTPEEIADLAKEIDERLKGNWMTTKEDEELQKKFWDIIPETNIVGKEKGIIGAQFLRQNKELLK
jgi:putative glycosyltransferase (TIGR04372 family)